jgi:hypothetical protein
MTTIHTRFGSMTLTEHGGDKEEPQGSWVPGLLILIVIAAIVIGCVVGAVQAIFPGKKASAAPPISCANQVREDIRYEEEQSGFRSNLFRIPIAHCVPGAIEGEDGWANAQLVWNNGKIDWWSCRDRVHCEAVS